MSFHDDPPDPAAPDAAAPHRLGWPRLVLLAVWAAVSFGTCFFARDLQALLDDQALAYALAAQGILIVFIVLVVLNARLPQRHEARMQEDAGGTEAGG